MSLTKEVADAMFNTGVPLSLADCNKIWKAIQPFVNSAPSATRRSILDECIQRLTDEYADPERFSPDADIYNSAVGYCIGALIAMRDAAPSSAVTEVVAHWQPIESVPRDGQHVLIAQFDDNAVGFGYCGGKRQAMQVVAHWFEDDPKLGGSGKAGLYGSVYGSDQPEPFAGLTHWMPLPSPPMNRDEPNG